MAGVALGGNLPLGDGNGFEAIAADMVANPSRMRVAVIIFDASYVKVKTDDKSSTAIIRIRRGEVVTDTAYAALLQRILMHEFEQRTGQTTLPMEMEEETNAAFAEFDDTATIDGQRLLDDETAPTED